MKLLFRIATTDDSQTWMRMRESLYSDVDEAFHLAELEKIVRTPDLESYLVEVESEPAGLLELALRNFVDGCLSSPVGYIEGIFVEPVFRNRNIGSRMVEFAREGCRGRGCSEIATDAELSEDDSQKFHLKMGFKETYRIVQYRDEL